MLNVVNRVITVLALLGLIACAALAAIGVFLPTTLVDRAAMTVTSLIQMPALMTATEQALVVAVAALVILVSFILLVVELSPPEREDLVRVRGTDGSETGIARSAIQNRVQYTIDRLDDVIQVDPAIRGTGKGLEVHLDVVTSPFVDVPMKTEEIRAATRDVIEQQMGLVLRRITVKLDHEKFREAAAEGTSI
jgi:predicted signal transduction protein with EAL and GGDEF domain